MIELERGANRVAEELDFMAHQFGSQILGGQCCDRADVRKVGSARDIGVVLLATLALLFTGVIGGKAILEVLCCRDLQLQIEQRLFEVTR